MAENLFLKAKESKANISSSASIQNKNVINIDHDSKKEVDNYAIAAENLRVAKKEYDNIKDKVLPKIRDEYLTMMYKYGASLDKPKVNGLNVQVAFVVQDKTGNYALSKNQLESLQSIFGENDIGKIVKEDTCYSLNNDILNLPKVMDKLSVKIMELVNEGVLTSEQAGSLLSAEHTKICNKHIFDDLPKMCKDLDTFKRTIDALGTNIVMYMKD